MAGLYIHIPFCRQACHYCNFHFSTSLQHKDKLVSALLKEIELQSGYVDNAKLETIYFGGGTPSILSATELNAILQAVNRNFEVSQDAEITIEANPEDFSKEQLEFWKAAGINRLSIGIQGFQDDMLKAWNRSHDSEQGEKAIQLALETGFNNLSVDLIYGDPLLSDEEWRNNIQRIVTSGVPHISCYALTVETGTALHHQITKGKTKPIDEEQSHRQFTILQEVLNDYGYEQYEISNFALPGMHSRHNTSYWQGIHYLGIGPAAHSFNGTTRQWNIANNQRYIQSIESEIIPAETEDITSEKRYNEWIMTGLRTSRGVDPAELQKLNEAYPALFEKSVATYLSKGQILRTAEGNYILAPDQYFFADGIAADLFII